MDTSPYERYARATSVSSLLLEDYVGHLGQLRQEQEQQPTEPPPLNLLTTTPKNFTQFVNKIGPMVELHNILVDIFSWKNPWRTAECMLVFTILCLRPVLFALVPLLTIIGIIVRNYYKILPEIAEGSRSGSPPPSPTNGTVSGFFSGRSSSISPGKSKSKSKKSSGGPSTMYSNRSASSVYAQNMQFIQNIMGVMCQMEEQVRDALKYLDWSDPDSTWQILLGTACFIPVVALATVYIPWNYAFLAMGLCALVGNSLWVRALVQTLFPWLCYHWATARIRAPVSLGWAKPRHALTNLTTIQQRPESVRSTPAGGSTATLIPSPSATSTSTPSAVLKIVVFENQRWWAGLGWVPHLFSSERPLWSDLKGKIKASHKDNMVPPKGYAWDPTSVWSISTTWSPDVPITDSQGWVYSDNHWKRPKSAGSLLTYTRRRKWERYALAAAPNRPSRTSSPTSVGPAAPADDSDAQTFVDGRSLNSQNDADSSHAPGSPGESETSSTPSTPSTEHRAKPTFPLGSDARQLAARASSPVLSNTTVIAQSVRGAPSP
ncbi:hypothetical protein H4R33_003676 [Dimargaris cristalligena]|nr:hypothetical protein H4R33_003676 [Dimargaris cristalligena]